MNFTLNNNKKKENHRKYEETHGNYNETKMVK